jgi:hypothetical protein
MAKQLDPANALVNLPNQPSVNEFRNKDILGSVKQRQQNGDDSSVESSEVSLNDIGMLPSTKVEQPKHNNESLNLN